MTQLTFFVDNKKIIREMKIIFDVETEDHVYETDTFQVKKDNKPKVLLWNIDVTIDTILSKYVPEDDDEVTMIPLISSQSQKHQKISTSTSSYQMRKVSRTTELIERMGKGRKVNRLFS